MSSAPQDQEAKEERLSTTSLSLSKLTAKIRRHRLMSFVRSSSDKGSQSHFSTSNDPDNRDNGEAMTSTMTTTPAPIPEDRKDAQSQFPQDSSGMPKVFDGEVSLPPLSPLPPLSSLLTTVHDDDEAAVPAAQITPEISSSPSGTAAVAPGSRVGTGVHCGSCAAPAGDDQVDHQNQLLSADEDSSTGANEANPDKDCISTDLLVQHMSDRLSLRHPAKEPINDRNPGSEERGSKFWDSQQCTTTNSAPTTNSATPNRRFSGKPLEPAIASGCTSTSSPASASASASASTLSYRKPSGPDAIQAYRDLQERVKRRLESRSHSTTAEDAEPLSRVDSSHPAPTTLLLPPKFSVDPTLFAQLQAKGSLQPLTLPPLAGPYKKVVEQRRRTLSQQRPCLAARRNCTLPPFERYLKAFHINSHKNDFSSSRAPLSENITSDSSSPTPQTSSNDREMARRRVWVQRIGSSATLVPVTEDDLVDDLRDAILRKYNNTLGRLFDSPDLIIKIVPRQSSNNSSSRPAPTDRILQPDERVWSAIEKFFPGGQTVDDALIIDIPQRRTPRPSPRHVYYSSDDVLRPAENTVEDYFPPQMPPPTTAAGPTNGITQHIHTPPAMAVLTTGQLPTVPSPSNFAHAHRPRVPRKHTHTPSPSMMPIPSSVALTTDQAIMPPQPMPLSPPTHPSNSPPPPAIPEQIQSQIQSPQPVPSSQPVPLNTTLTSPPTRGGSPRPHRTTSKRKVTRRTNANALNSLLDGTVPPINVLIVEDNIINLKLLEAFMKRLKVRWQTAMNGKEAVTKWRKGGFHLVLMDIQLPVMNGLDATREIRRLERINHIGVFSKSSHSYPFMETTSSQSDGEVAPQSPEDNNLDKELFKSPVIIVALTASSLQSDRHEALAAGCNDFLTKPVNMVWLEQKVTEWGSMQALIDYEGWCKWRGFPQHPPSDRSSGGRSAVTSPGPVPHGKTAIPGDGIPPLPEDPSLVNTRMTELAGAGLHENAMGFPFAAPPTEHSSSLHSVVSLAPRSPKHRHRLSANAIGTATSTLSPPPKNASFDEEFAAALDPDSVLPTSMHQIPTPSIEEVVDLGATPASNPSPAPRSLSASSGPARSTHSFRAQKNRSSTPSNMVPQGSPPS